ncbi:ATP-binding protein, partial [Streptomyces sp. T-3]|nr:ATP-binding protein [Streptomyces sp. T-3]
RPPLPAHAPDGTPPRPDGSAFLDWLRAPRPEAPPGVWRMGHRARGAEEPDVVPGRQLLSGALIAFLGGWLLCSLLWNGYLGDFWMWPWYVLAPDAWTSGRAGGGFASYVYVGLIFFGVMMVFGKVGGWSEVWRRYIAPHFKRPEPGLAPPAPQEDPARWPQLRQAGAPEVADKLTTEAAGGLMRDVDHARIDRAWQSVRSGRHALADFTRAVLKDGAAACLHPSGARDLTARSARHD